MVASKQKAQPQSSLWEARKWQWLEQANSEIDKIGEKDPMEYPVIDPQTEQPVGSRKIEIIVIEPRGSQVGMPPAPNPPHDSDDSSEDESDQEEQATGWKTYYCPPTIHEAEAALQKIDQAVWTPWPSGGYLYARLDWVTNEHYSAIKACLNQFLMASPKGKRFIEASKDAAQVQGWKETYTQTIRKWTQHSIQTGCLPSNHQGWWNVSILEDEDISGKIKLHLQQIGKLACAQDVVKFLQDPEVRDWLGITKKIKPKGQYFDRHERKDVVTYQQQTYIPFIKALERRQTIYNQDGIPDPTRPMS
ncbi:DDE family endonuclease [Rhizoctonia solani]|uniref:DDE family endonuclease n=1 Tax=Rhizoctonia solani TaxID=456999 RepID=A0A8H8P2Q0_9AGAM|nr:DDE family endonuclease [Rhizoctonia solani]QRW24130.1 DDE family endonuclease [Rhizoctonia solani]